MKCRCCGQCYKIPLVDPLTSRTNGFSVCPMCDTVPNAGEMTRSGPPNAAAQ